MNPGCKSPGCPGCWGICGTWGALGSAALGLLGSNPAGLGKPALGVAKLVDDVSGRSLGRRSTAAFTSTGP